MSRTPRPPHRRALSTVRAGGKIESGGDRQVAAALTVALRAPQQSRLEELPFTHGLHSYPARMAPSTARALLQLVAGDAKEGARVLDPFCGAGTVLVEARAMGLAAMGNDVNPLAVAIARAKVWTESHGRRKQLAAAATRIANDTIAKGKAARRSGFTDDPHRGPGGDAGQERDRRIRSWFHPHVRRELETLTGEIDKLRGNDEELASILTVALSAVLYKVSKRASDTDAREVERNVARGNPARFFLNRVTELCEGLAKLSRTRGPRVEVAEADARRLVSAGVKRGSIDAVVTSPPYAGTYDYADQHQLRLDFFGVSDQSFRTSEIGSRRGFHDDPSAAMRRWEKDLTSVLSEITKVIVPGGLVCFVIGDSFAGGRAIFADELLAKALGQRMHILGWASQTREKFGGAEGRAFGDREKREHIVVLKR